MPGREVLRIRDNLLPHYSELIYYGYWFSPEMELLQGMMDKAAGAGVRRGEPSSSTRAM